MTNEKTRFYSLLGFLGIALVFTFFVLRPFLYPLILAGIFAIIFQPLYQQILKRVNGQELVATVLTILVLIVCIIIPLAFLSWQIFKEAELLYLTLSSNFDQQVIVGLNQRLAEISPTLGNFSLDIDQYLKSGLVFLVQNLGVIFSNLARIFVSLFIFLLAFFFLLKDGDRLKRKIISFSPLSKDDDEAIIKKITVAINSVVKGSLFVAVLQGISCSAGFAIFGVPNPLMWGSLAVIGALIPGIGTALVLAPAILYLYFIGHIVGALGLLLWGIFAVGLIDNFLGPKFVGKGVGLHPFLILLSVFGGLSFFGPTGFVLGPLIVSLLFVLLDIYASILASRGLSK
ncbi:MAG: AI-2E family transporter [Candidatus Vogelbacteria bacterium]|nr:AI-2E family transporter [Candidatus Vogelbacteria bacterium]